VSPFLGAAFLVIVLQNLVYLGMPLTRSARAVVVATTALGAIAWFARTRRERTAPTGATTLALAFLIHLFNSVGALRLGTELYVGAAWIDGFNYVSIAELLVHEPVDVDSNVGLHLALGLAKRRDRIGQSVLHGTVAAVTGTTTRAAFGGTMLLACFLLPIAVRLLGSAAGLSRGAALALAATVGTSAVLVLLHLECFLSHFLSIPFIVLWVRMLHDEEGLDRRSAPVLALVAAFVWLCYTELSLLLIGTGAVACAASLLARRRAALPFASAIVLSLGLALALVPAFLPRSLAILERAAASGPVLEHVYPWARSVDALVTSWFGLALDWRRLTPLLRTVALPAVAILLTALAVAGLALALREPRRRTGTLVLLSLLALPAGLALAPTPHGYQLFKLLSTFQVILFLGLFSLAGALARRFPARPARLAVAIALGSLIAVNAVVGQAEIRRATRERPAPRSNAFLLLSPANRALLADLERTRGERLAIACENPLLAAWLCYHARNHDVVVLFPTVSDLDLENMGAPGLHLPGATGELEGGGSPPSKPRTAALPGLAGRVVRDLSQLEGRRLITAPEWSHVDPAGIAAGLALEWRNPNGIDAELVWIGNAAAFALKSLRAGAFVLDVEASPGPSRADARRTLRFSSDRLPPFEVACEGPCRLALELEAAAGDNVHSIAVSEPATVIPATPTDPRTLLLGLARIRVYRADEVAPDWRPGSRLTRGMAADGALASPVSSLVLRRESEDAPATLRLAFENDGDPTALDVRIASRSIGRATLESGWTKVELALPAGVFPGRVLAIELLTPPGRHAPVRLLEATLESLDAAPEPR
jgi:hypothetical protein